MDIPLRLEILRRLTGQLEEVTVANGYQHDLEGKVFRGRSVFGESDPGTLVSILEVPLQPDQIPAPRPGETNKGWWDLVIQGFVEDDKKHPTDPAHYLLADVKRKLAEVKRASQDFNILGPWPGRGGGGSPVVDMTIGPGVVRPPDEVSFQAYFWLTIALEVVDDLASPFTY